MGGSQHDRLNTYAGDVIRHKARQLIGKYGFTPDDYEDLTQEMTLDLLVRLPKFDPSRAGLNTFVARVVDRKVSTLIRFRRQEKRDYRCEACSLDGATPGENGGNAAVGEALSQDEYDLRVGKYTRTASERIDLRLDLMLAIEDLSPELRRLAELLFTHSVIEAAHELGVPRSTLYEKGRARLRKAFKDKGLREWI